jgi:hypothetical protein
VKEDEEEEEEEEMYPVDQLERCLSFSEARHGYAYE